METTKGEGERVFISHCLEGAFRRNSFKWVLVYHQPDGEGRVAWLGMGEQLPAGHCNGLSMSSWEL